MSGGTNKKCPKNNTKDFILKTVDTGLHYKKVKELYFGKENIFQIEINIYLYI